MLIILLWPITIFNVYHPLSLHYNLSLVVLMTIPQLMFMLFSEVIISSHGPPRNNVPLLNPWTESENKPLVDTAAEITWLRSFLNELGVSIPSSHVVYYSNVGATYLVANIVFHARTKHVEINFHLVGEKVTSLALDVRAIYSHQWLVS